MNRNNVTLHDILQYTPDALLCLFVFFVCMYSCLYCLVHTCVRTYHTYVRTYVRAYVRRVCVCVFVMCTHNPMNKHIMHASTHAVNVYSTCMGICISMYECACNMHKYECLHHVRAIDASATAHSKPVTSFNAEQMLIVILLLMYVCV